MNIRKTSLEAPSIKGKYRSRCFGLRKTSEVLKRCEATYIGSDVTNYEHPKSSKMGDDEWEKLPTEDKVVHKLWKARVAGYEEAKKRFQMVDNEKTKEFTSYLGLLKKFVTDSNAIAQEKGLLATLAFVENVAESSRVCSDVVSGVVAKVLNGKPKVKQIGMDICLMYIENEKQDIVMEELINGFSNKQPKIVAACASLVNQAIREFGGKVITMKPVVKSLQKLLENPDKNVREEAKLLAIELYKWIRDAIRPQLVNIKPVQMKELEDEWSELDSAKPKPTRFTKTEQAKRAVAPPPREEQQTDGAGGTVAEEAVEVDEAIDPYDLMDPIDIIPLMPKNFYEQIVHTKWSERKEALENLDKLTSKPKIEAGHFGELMGWLKKVISKDSNVVVVAIAAKCVQGLANGLRTKFAPYVPMIASAILEKFKEKKMNVVLALRDAIDAVFLTTSLSCMAEDILAALENKNPNVKEETCKFLTRATSRLNQATLPKSLLKQLAPALIKQMDGTVGAVRDGAAETLGMTMRAIGEKAMLPYIDQLDKIKAEKVKECYEKAEPASSSGAPGKSPQAPRPATAPAKASSAPPSEAPSTQSVQRVPSKRPETANPKKKAKPQSAKQGASKKPGKSASGGKKPKKGAAAYAEDELEPTELELPEGVVEDIALESLGETVCKQLCSSNWKERLEAVEEITKKVNSMTPDSKTAQALVRTLAKKPGFKDNNMMTLKGKFALLGIIAKQSKPFSRRTAIYAIAGLIEKIGDLKLKDAVKETLKIFAENISLNYVSLKVAKVSSEVKNPKTQAEALVWMSEALKEFGFKIDTKPHFAFVKASLQNINPGIRAAAVQFLATMFIYIGASLRTLFEDEKPALLQQIDTEFDKVKGEKPPTPTRKIAGDEDDDDDEKDVQGDESENDEVDGGGGAGGGGGGFNPEDLVDRKNISEKITEGLIAKLSDKNWKIRNEGLQEVVDMLNENKFILPDIGELPTAMKARLGDSNKNIIIISLGICKTLAQAMGLPIARHKSTLLPSMISTMADAKPQVQTAAREALSIWHSKIGFKEFVTDEILSTALRIPKPNLRISLLSWMEQILPEEKKKLPVELNESIAPLFVCLEDRNADVRKNAQAVLPLMMAHTGYEAMAKVANKLEATSKNAVVSVIDKARESCVMIQNVKKPKTGKSGKSAAPPSVAPSVADIDLKDIKKSSEEQKKKPVESKKAAKKPTSAAPSKKKKDEEEDGPAVIHKVGKEQRIKDEKGLKTLKWNFTTPRDEMVQQLKDQMTPCFSASMVKKLFHDDFKYHIEAISLFSEAISSNRPAMIESLDIILRWFSLRFFDTNTTVLLKSLEFLEALFDMLSSEGYRLSEYEGSAFVPYLVLKIGDPKDNVRKSVHNLFKKFTDIYPATKLFTYLLEGLVSKNSKTRMECLTELGFLISKFGMEVCQPTPPKALKEMATQIGDRDNGVRSAALNAIVEAYNIVGEQVFKLIGRLSDKDRSYLEERIKRAGKAKPAAAPEPKKSTADQKQSKPGKKSSTESKDQVDSDVVVVSKMKPRGAANLGEQVASGSNQEVKVKHEFELNYDEIGKDVIRGSQPKLLQIDYEDEDFAMAKPLNVAGKTSMTTAARDISAWLDLTIAQIANSDVNVSMEALAQFEEVFKRHGEEIEIIKKIDQYLLTCLVQFRMLFSRHLESTDHTREEVIRLLKYLLNGIMISFTTPSLAKAVSKDVLKDVAGFLLTTTHDSKLTSLEECDTVIKTINILMLKIIQHGDHTSCFWALIKLLMDGIEHNQPQKIHDLYLKCLWKLARFLPDVIQDIQVDAVLLDIHIFLKKYPSSYWKTKEDQRPMSTVTVFLRTLMKLLGAELLNKTGLIVDEDSSELVGFLKKTLRKPTDEDVPVKAPNRALATNKPESTKNADRGAMDILQDIFSKIGSKENSQEGLKELYEFKEKYPDVDVNPFIAKASQFFRNYVERGLKAIEQERKSAKIPTSTATGMIPAPQGSSTVNGSGAEKYLDRLKVLREKYLQINAKQEPEKSEEEVLKPTETPVELSKTKEVENLPDTIQPMEKKEKKEVNIDDIKRRLQQIKMGSKT